MFFKWLIGKRKDDFRSLPALERPAAAQDQDPQQQLHATAPSVEYCSRMAFKLTPTYSNRLQARLRWLQVLKAAQQPSGGGWDPNFSSEYMTPKRLRQLADAIDAAFLNGSFASVCGPHYTVQEQHIAGPVAGVDRAAVCNAVAGFEPATNTIMFFRPGWRKRPSMRCPIQADGVYCTNKLSWLAHTLGHEMVHCIVYHACPEARHLHAYQHDNGHGPIFRQLNRHIFGHSTTKYKAGWSRLGAGMKLEPLLLLQQPELHQQQPPPRSRHSRRQQRRQQLWQLSALDTGLESTAGRVSDRGLPTSRLKCCQDVASINGSSSSKGINDACSCTSTASGADDDGSSEGISSSSSYGRSKLSLIRSRTSQRHQHQLQPTGVPADSSTLPPLMSHRLRTWWSW